MIEGWSGLERGQKMNPNGNKIFSLVSLSVVMETGPEVVCFQNVQDSNNNEIRTFSKGYLHRFPVSAPRSHEGLTVETSVVETLSDG